MAPDPEAVKPVATKDIDWTRDAKVLAAYAGFIRGATNARHAAVDALTGLLSLMGESAAPRPLAERSETSGAWAAALPATRT